ncbi:MAG: family 16 glycoside hydrolase [Verrucomicrobiota bacterium]
MQPLLLLLAVSSFASVAYCAPNALADGKSFEGFQLWLNGVKTVDYTESEPGIEQSGRIALQIHGGAKAVASYKDIVIEELP